MATSWKLPLAAAAGEVAEPPPPPPAGPASPPGPATSSAGAPLGRPGVSAARREVQAAGAAGTCSPRVGGPGGQCLGGQGPTRVSLGGWGRARVVLTGPRALGSHFLGEESGVVRAPRGVPHQAACTPSEPANALGPPARVSTGYLLPIGARRGPLSLVCPCPGPHLML